MVPVRGFNCILVDYSDWKHVKIAFYTFVIIAGMVPDHVFDQMQGPDVDVHLYSVTLTPLQIEVIQALPTQVKDLIRIVKYWGDVKKGVCDDCIA